MSNASTPTDWASTPETTQVPVRGDCGHIYLVPLARLADGAEFHCSTCGQADRFDEEAVKATIEELAELQKEEGTEGFAARVGAFLAGKRKGGGSDS